MPGAHCVVHAAQVGQQPRGRQAQVAAATLRVGRRRVVADGPVAGPARRAVLAPEQKLDRVPARGDVRLAALLVGGHDDVRGDLRDATAVVDDACIGVARDVVDVRLVHRPGVDQPFGPVLRVVDRSAVEAKRLGDDVVVARGQPRLLGVLQPRRARGGDEGVDRPLHPGRAVDRRAVGAVDDRGVVGDDRGLGGPGRLLRVIVLAAAPRQRAGARQPDGQRPLEAHVSTPVVERAESALRST